MAIVKQRLKRYNGSTYDTIHLESEISCITNLSDELNNRALSKTLTKAEYDALVEAGTMDPTVTYFITDDQGTDGLAYTQAQTDALLNTKVPVIGKGKNLLHNWYFVGGGTGAGVFPVNQRGQASYSGNYYYFDRWMGSTSLTATLQSDGVFVSSSGSSGVSFFQGMPIEPLLGKTVTGSILTADGTLYVGTGTLPSTVPTSGNVYAFSIDTNVGKFNLAYVSVRSQVEFTVTLPASGRSIKLVAAKLELGTTQTLAHNEGTTTSPVWVLNDIPDYQEELVKCQEYLNIFDVGVIGNGFMNTANIAICEIPTPVSMRPIAANTDVSFTGTLQVIGNGVIVNASAVKIHSVNKGGVIVSITVPNGISAFLPVTVAIGNSSNIILTAE